MYIYVCVYIYRTASAANLAAMTQRATECGLKLLVYEALKC